MVKIQIIGAGIVGKAHGKMLEKLGHEVHYQDKDWGEMVSDAKWYFICTHEDLVDRVIHQYFNCLTGKVIVIKSTLTPLLWWTLKEKYRKHIGFIINPEFLRARDSLWMSLNPKYIVIGTNNKLNPHAKRLGKLYKPLGAKTFITTPEIAIMVKLASNAYLATAISFWNEIWQVCEKTEINSFLVGKINSYENKRIPKHGSILHGQSFAGHCLPKDLDQLIEFGEMVDVPMHLLKAVKQVNKDMVEKEK